MKKDSKKMLFEMMHKVGNMPLNEDNYQQQFRDDEISQSQERQLDRYGDDDYYQSSHFDDSQKKLKKELEVIEKKILDLTKSFVIKTIQSGHFDSVNRELLLQKIEKTINDTYDENYDGGW